MPECVKKTAHSSNIKSSTKGLLCRRKVEEKDKEGQRVEGGWRARRS